MTTLLNVPGNSAGAMNGDGSRKALLHSTEGAKWEGAVAAYQANNSWPHRTVDGPRRIVVKHLPLDVAARSLRNEAGGVETNREGTILIQYELVGFAATPGLGWSAEDWEWFGREVLGPDCRATGVPVQSTLSWVSYPASYGKSAPQRLSGAAWDAYDGICGHQHAPENTHGDPGAIPIALLLASAGSRAQPTPVPLEEDAVFTMQTSGQPVRLVIGGVAIGFNDTGTRDRVLSAFREAGVLTTKPVEFDHAADHDLVLAKLVTQGDLDAILKAASTTQLAESMVDVDAIRKNLGTGDGDVLRAPLREVVAEALRLAERAEA